MTRRVLLCLAATFSVIASALAPTTAGATAADEAVIESAYLGLVGRQPDATGALYWSSRLAAGATYQDVVAGIGDSDEQRNLVVRDAYIRILRRVPEPAGLSYWADGLIDRSSERQLYAELFASAEYYAQSGGNDGSFVDGLYGDALNRAPEPAGRSYWLALLTNGLSRYQVARTFLALPEAAFQPDLAVVNAVPRPDSTTSSVSTISITLDRPVDAEESAVLVAIGGRRLAGTMTNGSSPNDLVFTPTRRPGWIAAGQLASAVVTVFASNGSTIERTDFGFSYQPTTTGGTLNELIIAFYGHAKTPVLGVMGEGTPAEAAQRLLQQAEPYRIDGRPVVPAFELIATLATAAPGPSNNYSSRTDHGLIRPYLDAIRDIDGRLILDIQPGRADFETEARYYHPLLLEPEVGLALDPEWKVGPGETPAGNIGSVTAGEINRVSAYLSQIVLANDLPDKILVIHRFRPDMVQNPEAIVSRPGVVILFQADGEGSPPPKIADYNTLLPDRFARGMKVFYDEDSPQMSPADVLSLTPAPDYVSYQ